MKTKIWTVTHNNEPATLKEWKNPLLPIFYAFKIFGRFPFKKDVLGRLRFRLLSPPSVWALVTISLQALVVIKIYIWKLTDSKNWASFDLTVASVQELLILNTTFHAFTTWLDTPAITRAFNRWLIFHKKLYTTTRREAISPLLNHSFWGIISIAFITIVIFIGAMFKMNDDDYVFGIVALKEAIYSICVFYLTTLAWCWVVYCLTVKKTAEILKEHMSQTLSYHLKSENLAELRSLWVELHVCTVEMSNAIGKTVLMGLMVSYMLTLFSLYAGLMYVLVDNYSLKLGYIPLALVHSHTICIIVYTFGYFAQQSMTENMLFLLYSKQWQHCNSTVKTELNLLLDVIEMSSPCFDIKGLITLNRHGYVKVLSGILTYLVILMQIKVSADSTTK